jgi:predicted nucleotidyltransferase component of viral defense system
MLNIEKHKVVLLQILRELYTDEELLSKLVFKGGTCLMLFYGLDRFSTDLDFDLRDEAGELDSSRIIRIAEKYLTVDDFCEKHFTYFLLGSYENGLQHIKIEINKRQWPQTMENKDFYGLTIPTLATDKMLAHKLCAITNRKTLQNRDLYDAWFMFTKGFQVDDEIIRLRTEMSTKEYLTKLTDILDDPKIVQNILHGLGEVLSRERKIWVKNNLARELVAQLKIYPY